MEKTYCPDKFSGWRLLPNGDHAAMFEHEDEDTNILSYYETFLLSEISESYRTLTGFMSVFKTHNMYYEFLRVYARLHVVIVANRIHVHDAHGVLLFAVI